MTDNATKEATILNEKGPGSVQQTICLSLALMAWAYFLIGFPVLIHRLFFLFQLQQGDAIEVERALIILRGDALYPDISKGGPFLYAAYPPLFFWLQSKLMRFFSNFWVPGRLLAFTGYLGCAGLMIAWGWKRWGIVLSLLFSSLFLCFPTWAQWGTVDRPDAVYLFINFAAFLLLYGFTQKGGLQAKALPLLMGAGLLNGTALLLKQSAYSLVGSFGLTCLIKRQWKAFLIFFLTALVVALPLCLWLNLQTQGQFYNHTVRWLNTGYDWRTLWDWMHKEFLWEIGWLVLALGLVILFKKTPLLLTAQLGMAAFNLFSLGRGGGAENYWLEFILYGVFFVGELFGAGEYRAWVTPVRKQVFLWGMAGVLSLGLLYNLLGHWPTLPDDQTVLMKQDAIQIYKSPGEHLALDLDLPLMAGKKIWIQPYEFDAMVRKGFWSPVPLMREIEAKKFTTIEIYDIPVQTLLPQVVVDDIQKNYHVVIRKYGRLWYIPNKS